MFYKHHSSFRFGKKSFCSKYLEKTKALISCAVIAQLIYVFVFPYAKSRFSHDGAQDFKKIIILIIYSLNLNFEIEASIYSGYLVRTKIQYLEKYESDFYVVEGKKKAVLQTF